MKKDYLGMEAVVIPLKDSDLIKTESSDEPCPPKWVANDTIIWNGFTVCKSMVDGSGDYTGEYDVVPGDD